MAVESKPLFHPEVIRQHLRHFLVPVSMEDSRPSRSDRLIGISEIKHLAARPGGFPQSAA
jgi:hypothetical protein